MGLHCGRAGLGDRPIGPAALPAPPIPWAHPSHVLDRQQGPEQGDALGRGVTPEDRSDGPQSCAQGQSRRTR